MGGAAASLSRNGRLRLFLLGALWLLTSGCDHGDGALTSAPPAKPRRVATDESSTRPQAASLPPRARRLPDAKIAHEATASLSPVRSSAEQTSVPDEPANAGEGPSAKNTSPAVQSDSAERIALLLPHGPVIVELRLTIDGKPIRAVSEEMVDDVLRAADRNHDGRATWGEIFAEPGRILGQRIDSSLHFSSRKQFMQANDANRNGRVDRDEARRFVERAKGAGAAFVLDSSADYYESNLRQSIVRTLLDKNADGVIDSRELTSAEQRLLVTDSNNDHVVAWPELDDSLAGDEQAEESPKKKRKKERLRRSGTAMQHRDQRESALAPASAAADLAALVLAPQLDWRRILGEIYNDRFDVEEIRLDAEVQPQIVVSARFGKRDDSSPGLVLEHIAPELHLIEQHLSEVYGDLVVQAARFRVRFAIDDRPFLRANDSQRNEAKPADDARPPQLAPVQAVACNEDDVLFALLDANQDRRLTPRELRRAAEALRSIDFDGDGRITPEEIPASLVIWLGRNLSPDAAPQRLPSTAIANAPPPGPAWFSPMDVNRDQEISLEEFPGSAEKFRALDLNGDGFIASSEAEAAESAPRR